MNRKIALIFAGLLAACAAGCQYYKVTDLQSGREFYVGPTLALPEDIKGPQAFTDAATGDRVVTSSFTAHKISEDDFKAAVGKP